MKKLKLLLIILWMFIIFMFSHQKADDSSKLSDGLILKTVRIIEKITHKEYSDEEILNKFVKPVRKLAHFTIYLILGILVYLYIKELQISKIFIISLLICVLYAVSDEIHQLFIVGRSGRIFDVFVDSLGSLTGILLMKKVGRLHEKNK
ncbi:MAG: VanZ family protein [Lactobacillales bacterium]|nr:VanZ family protein [Lactobacillales bacterium]